MKEIDELYQEILQEERLKGEFVQAAKDNQIEAFLRKNNCNATLAELQEFAEKKQSELGSLSDAELDAAAGGVTWEEAFSSIVSLGAFCAFFVGVSALGKGTGWREGSDLLLCHNCEK